VALPAALLSLLHGLLMYFQPLLAFLLGIGVLYLTMGFRQFSHFFTNIHLALRQGDIRPGAPVARAVASSRRRPPHVGRHRPPGHRRSPALGASARVRAAALVRLLGPAGALFYRLAHTFDDLWGRRSEAEFGEFGQFAHQAFALIDWVPIRVTAASFAVVGDFEDAVHCWRTQAVRWPEAGSGILLASGAGALGVRLGMPVHEAIQEMDESADRPELGLGEDADPDFMQSTIGLVWRSLVLGLAVLALIWVSGWVGG
jgi:adenosylcobinamide-phosphate synthase